jgi:precorrin-6A/cobalt-precorrin-6A reductase
MTVLVLAGTAEARELCTELAAQDVPAIASLAGATRKPLPQGIPTRSGGFGGADGLGSWLAENRISAVIDATHPFAATMPWNAAKACAETGTPRVRLLRPPWSERPNWKTATTIEDAAAALPPGARALLTTGSGSARTFASRTDVTCWLRSIEPVSDLPPHIHPLIARPPFTLEYEVEQLHTIKATHLVTKNAGGAGTAKLDAADALCLPVIAVARPKPPPGPTVTTPDQAVAWLRQTVGAVP